MSFELNKIMNIDFSLSTQRNFDANVESKINISIDNPDTDTHLIIRFPLKSIGSSTEKEF